MNTIYKPNGRAGEYGEYALNIYDGCPHGCKYCYAPNCLHKDREVFHASCTPRPNIVEETAKRLAKGDIKGKHIFLCFTCDPFPMGIDHTPTREIIKLIHDSGNYVQILTKGQLSEADRKCLLPKDIFGVSFSADWGSSRFIEPNTLQPDYRLGQLAYIRSTIGCKTFVSCEPALNENDIYNLIRHNFGADEFKIGKLNYNTLSEYNLPDINWGEFGRKCEYLCKENWRKYYIKESLQKEMNK